MENKTKLTKAELLSAISFYQELLFKIKDYCDNPEQFKDGKYVRDKSECYAAAIGAIGFNVDHALGLDD